LCNRPSNRALVGDPENNSFPTGEQLIRRFHRGRIVWESPKPVKPTPHTKNLEMLD
jgi:hypothetical protein